MIKSRIGGDSFLGPTDTPQKPKKFLMKITNPEIRFYKSIRQVFKPNSVRNILKNLKVRVFRKISFGLTTPKIQIS